MKSKIFGSIFLNVVKQRENSDVALELMISCYIKDFWKGLSYLCLFIYVIIWGLVLQAQDKKVCPIYLFL